MVRVRLASACAKIKPACTAVIVAATLLVYRLGLYTNPLSRGTGTLDGKSARLHPSLGSSNNFTDGNTPSGEVALTPGLNVPLDPLMAVEEEARTTRAVSSLAPEPSKKQRGHDVTSRKPSTGSHDGAIPELIALAGPVTAVRDEANATHSDSPLDAQHSGEPSANMTGTYLAKGPADSLESGHQTSTAASSTTTSKHSLHQKLRNESQASLLVRLVSQYTQELPEQVTRILEVGYFRSGSSFLGQLLSANPRTFYHYEPLRTLTRGVRLQTDDSRRGLQYLDDFFGCNFEKHRDHLELAKKYPHPFQQNTYLWDACHGVRPVCLHPEFLNRMCRTAPTQFLLREDPPMAGHVKVIHLVRDPRAIWASRQRLLWCRRRENCSSAAVLCADMERDLDAYDSFSRHVPQGVTFQVRHEDLATDPFNTTEKMFQALGLPYTAFVRRFIDSHTRETNPKVRRNPYATSKNSTDVAYSWKRRLRPADVKRINKECLNVIRRLGYEL